MELTSRELLTHLFHTAIEAVDGRRCVAHWCQQQTTHFSHVIAIGKAAPAMLQGAIDSRVEFQQALLICPQRSAPRALHKNKAIQICEASHPVPDTSSLQAGDALLRFIAGLPGDARLLFLISGGTSSLVEVLQDGITLDDLQSINEYLLASGKNIHAINAWRQCFSKIKGGGLLDYLALDQSQQLLISDVKGDDPTVIGSGLLVRNINQTDGDENLQRYRTKLAPVIMSPNQTTRIQTEIIANQAMALRVAAEEVANMELLCFLHEEFIEADAVAEGERLAQWLLNQAPTGVHIWGAETTVTLPPRPGIGGRNQSFALALANILAEADLDSDDIGVLAAGTDGIDGNTVCAGAVVFASTARQIMQGGYDIKAELAAANAGTLLMLTRDHLKTGATGTNVMDLIIAWKQA